MFGLVFFRLFLAKETKFHFPHAMNLGCYFPGASFLVVWQDAVGGWHVRGASPASPASPALGHAMAPTRSWCLGMPSRIRAWHLQQDLCWEGMQQGKLAACEIWQASAFQTVIADVSRQWVIILRAQGVVGRSSSIFLRQVGWLAAQACDMGLRKDGDEAGSSEQGWGKPHHESHIKQSILNASFPPQHGRKAG